MDDQGRGLLEVAVSLLGELSLDKVIDRLLASARDMTDARYAALGVLNDHKTELERFITAGMADDTRTSIGPLPRGRGVLGELIRDPRPLRLADVGAHPRSYGFPLAHPPMSSFLGVPIVAGGVPFGSLYLTEKAGAAQFTSEDEESATTLARFAGVAIDHARQYTGVAERRDELTRMVAALQATTEITRAVAGATDVAMVLELVAKRGRALVSAEALVIELVDGNEILVAAGAGALPEGMIGARLAMDDTVASAALRTKSTLRLELEINRSRFRQHGLGRLGAGFETGLVVPLLFKGRGYGALIALERLGDEPAFTAEDQRLLEAFASSAATAVATAQSAAFEVGRQRLAATEDERRRWARELHDETLQSLAALRIGLSAARRKGGLDVLDAAVAAGISSLEDGISSLRALVTDLRPGALDDLGLEAAIEALCERARGHGLDVDFSTDLAYEHHRMTTRHTSELETAIYRISQEALTNASKHGHARRVMVEIDENPTTVDIVIRDDGIGFDPHSSTAGFGLMGMRERVALLHGTVNVVSVVGEGTTVTASFPASRRSFTGAPPAVHDRHTTATG